MTLRSPLTLALALAGAAPAAAQTTVVDEGSFRITVRGAAIGTEAFTIRRSGAGANAATVAQGRIILDTGERIRSVVQLQGPGFRPSAYQIEVAGDNSQNITARSAGNRFRATIVSSGGERMSEYLFDPAAVVVDDAVAHHHYFLAVAGGGERRVPVILPRQSRQVTATVTPRGAETIRLDDRQVSARRIDVEIPGLDPRTVWVDHRSRVLRLRIPDQHLLAERTSLP